MPIRHRCRCCCCQAILARLQFRPRHSPLELPGCAIPSLACHPCRCSSADLDSWHGQLLRSSLKFPGSCPPRPCHVQTSVAGMITVLESGAELQGTWHAWDGKVIPW